MEVEIEIIRKLLTSSIAVEPFANCLTR